MKRDCEHFINKSWAKCIVWGEPTCENCKSYKSNKEAFVFR